MLGAPGMHVPIAPLSLALLLVACASAPDARVQEPAPAEGTVVLSIGAPKRAPGTDLTVTFEAVVSDSRCPTGVQCVWAGEVAVRIRMSAPNLEPVTTTLHTNLDTAKETTYGAWKLSIQAVTPAPTATGGVRAEDYRLTLLITRK